jgi:hypothetical protein
LDNFDDTYLGAKSSDPSTDNDGDALNAGDLYFNTTINALKVYDGSAWNTASPDLVGDTTPQLGGNLDTNGNDITGTGDINITGTVTADGLTVDGGANALTRTSSGAEVDVLELRNNATATNTATTLKFANSTVAGSNSGSTELVGIRTGTNTGDFKIRTASSAPAMIDRLLVNSGGDISFYADDGTTQGLYWDASTQRLGLGTSSPSTKLHISGNASNASALSDTVTDFALKFDSATTGGNFSNAICFAEGNNVNASIASFDGGAGGAQGLVFGTGASNTERMRIDSSGNLLVGTSNTSWTTDEGLRYFNGSSLIVTRDSDEPLNLNRTTNDGDIAGFKKDGTTVGSISVTGSGTTYNTTSDIRLKTAIEPIDHATDMLMAMNPVSHRWKADPDADAVHGFIAQEMEEIVPEAVSKGDSEDDMWSMDYGRITPVLVAALQDAHRKIEDLETRLAALEANSQE